MKILVVGNASNLDELKLKFGPDQTYLLKESGEQNMASLAGADVVFDFISRKEFIRERYVNYTKPVFFNTALITLSELTSQSDISQRDFFFGFCGMPTFVNRAVMEVSISSKKNEALLKEICAQLSTDFVLVADRVGLVTPRVISMIINEAYCTLEEGTASRNDIDLAMKLGTNYPYGPFEWAKHIGINHVIELLDAVYRDTHDDRYKVNDLLRSEAAK